MNISREYFSQTLQLNANNKMFLYATEYGGGLSLRVGSYSLISITAINRVPAVMEYISGNI